MSKPTTITAYLKTVPEDRMQAFQTLRQVINDNIDSGFEEGILYNMLGWYVPLATYPDGYHCAKNAPLPFVNMANQKGYIAVYHMGMYADQDIYDWFVKEYPKQAKYKLDMGKSCIRFKKMDDIPFELVAELMSKMKMKNWIKLYERDIKK